MIEKLINDLAALAAGADNAEQILGSGFYSLEVTREYTPRGTRLKVAAQGDIKSMPFELADAIISEGMANSHTAGGCIFYPVERVVGGVNISIVGVDRENDHDN